MRVCACVRACVSTPRCDTATAPEAPHLRPHAVGVPVPQGLKDTNQRGSVASVHRSERLVQPSSLWVSSQGVATQCFSWFQILVVAYV